jgi:hypothetical protein
MIYGLKSSESLQITTVLLDLRGDKDEYGREGSTEAKKSPERFSLL